MKLTRRKQRTQAGRPKNKKAQPNGWGAEAPQGWGPALTKKASSAEPGRTFLRHLPYHTDASLVK